MIVIPTLSLARGGAPAPAVGIPKAPNGSSDDPHASAGSLVAAGFSVVHLTATGFAADRQARLLEVVRHSPAHFLVELPETDEGMLVEMLEAGGAGVVVRCTEGAAARRCGELAATAPQAVVADLSSSNGVVDSSARGLPAILDRIQVLEEYPFAALLVSEGQATAQDLARLEAIADASPWPLFVRTSGDPLQRLHNLAERGVAGAVLAAGATGELAELSFLAAGLEA